MGCVYRLTSPSGKNYIGVTRKNAEERFKQHIIDANRKDNKRPISAAIRKYGPSSFKIETLIYSDNADELKKLEVEYIKKYNTKTPNGYNNTDGGNGVVGHDSESEKRRIENFKKTSSTLESKEKRKKIHTDLWTEERKNKRSEDITKLWENEDYRTRTSNAHIGRVKTEEEKIKRANSLKKFYEDNPDEKDKISLRFKEKWQDPNFKQKMEDSRTPEGNKRIGDSSKKRWEDPVKRSSMMEAQKASFTPERIKQLSDTQKKVMENEEIRLQIAISLNKFKGKIFRKLKKENPTKKDGLVRRTWDLLGEIFTAEEAIRIGWWSRYFDRSIVSGWIAIVE